MLLVHRVGRNAEVAHSKQNMRVEFLDQSDVLHTVCLLLEQGSDRYEGHLVRELTDLARRLWQSLLARVSNEEVPTIHRAKAY